MAAVRGRTVTRWLASVVAAAVAFTMSTDVAQAADPDAARATWSRGPEMQISGPQIARLSADRILALRIEPRTCVSGVGGCYVPVYDPLPAFVIDVRRGTSTPVAGPPVGMDLGSTALGLDGDAYFPLKDPKDRARGSDPTALARYIGAEDRWERFPLPSGLTSRFGLTVVDRRLVALDVTQTETSGMILGADGHWRALPPNPLWAGTGWSGGVFAADGQLLAARSLGPPPTPPATCATPGACASSVASLSIDDDGRPAAAWRRLPGIPFAVQGGAAVIDHYLTWPYATYDLRTGRTKVIPENVRQPNRARIIRDGVVLGRWLTIGGGLFNPTSGNWIPVPATESSSSPPKSSYPAGIAGPRVDEGSCGHLDGSDNLIRLCKPPRVTEGGTILSVAGGFGPGTVEVLRVSEN